MKRRILVLAAGFAALLPFVLLPTTASWTDDAWFEANVSAGTWPTGPPTSCTWVYTATGQPSGRPCTVVSVIAANNGDPNAPVGQRIYALRVTLAGSGWSDTEQILLDLDLSAASGIPSNWVWSTSGVGNSDYIAYPGFSCDSLPQLRVLAPAWMGTGEAFSEIRENRDNTPGLVCAD